MLQQGSRERQQQQTTTAVYNRQEYNFLSRNSAHVTMAVIVSNAFLTVLLPSVDGSQ